MTLGLVFWGAPKPAGERYMTLGRVFWVLMLLWAVFSVWWLYPLDRNGAWPQSAFLFVLLLILGWGVFGAPIR